MSAGRNPWQHVKICIKWLWPANPPLPPPSRKGSLGTREFALWSIPAYAGVPRKSSCPRKSAAPASAWLANAGASNVMLQEDSDGAARSSVGDNRSPYREVLVDASHPRGRIAQWIQRARIQVILSIENPHVMRCLRSGRVRGPELLVPGAESRRCR